MTKKIIRKYIELFIIFGSLFILLYTIIDLREQVKEVEVLQFKLDSVTVKADILYDRNYSIDVQNANLNAALEYLRRNNPKAAQDFEKHMRNEIK